MKDLKPYRMLLLAAAAALVGCTSSDGATTVDTELRSLIELNAMTGDPARKFDVRPLASPLAQLGMRLFFSKSLGGEFDVACASCHHPQLGGGDALALPIGVHANAPDVIGPGRSQLAAAPLVPRHSPSTFNVALVDHALFADGRVENLLPVLGSNGAGRPLSTPDVSFGDTDPDAGPNLPAAQARMPVTSVDEMRGTLMPGADNADLRRYLAERLGGYGRGTGLLASNEWLPLFRSAFNAPDGSAEQLITFDNMVTAIAEYERSQVFVDTPWHDYVSGDLAALNDQEKRGAVLFLKPFQQGGSGCVICHNGDLFSDESYHSTAFPQFGPGKGQGADGTEDQGRGAISGVEANLYGFRTPALLNVELTAPYSHAGAYATLEETVRQYSNHHGAIADFVAGARWCQLPPFDLMPAADCALLYPNALADSEQAALKLDRDLAPFGAPALAPPFTDEQVAELVAFMRALTDRCAADRLCIAKWVPPRDGGPDGQQLEALDQHGDPL